MVFWYSLLHMHTWRLWRQYSHFRRVSTDDCTMDPPKSAQTAVIQFLLAEWEHASQIYRMMKAVLGEQCLAQCTIFRWCQRYQAGRMNIKDLPHPGHAHVVINSAIWCLRVRPDNVDTTEIWCTVRDTALLTPLSSFDKFGKHAPILEEIE